MPKENNRADRQLEKDLIHRCGLSHVRKVNGITFSATCNFCTTVGKDLAKVGAIRECTSHICQYQPPWRTGKFTGHLEEVHKST